MINEMPEKYNTYLMFPDFMNHEKATLWFTRKDNNREAKFMFYRAVEFTSIRKGTCGSWNPDSDSNYDPDGMYYFVDKMTYLDPIQAYAYYRLVSEDNILELRDKVLNLTFTEAVSFLANSLKVKMIVASAILGIIEFLPDDFTSLSSMELNKIEEAGGGIIDDKNGTHMSNGVCISSVTVWRNMIGGGVMPVFLNLYAAHKKPNYIYGARGYEGSFDLDDICPLWRGVF